MFDASDEHIISELGRRARVAAGRRTLVLIAENEPQDTNLLRSIAQRGCGLDAVWNDDFHHSATVALLGLRQAYYTDYLGRAQEFVAAMKFGYLYQGQHYGWQKKRRGAPGLDLEPRRFVAFLENHDQVANSARGERLRFRAHPAQLRAMTATLLLGPWTPMLFQGQELASQRHFNYFADFKGGLGEAVERGRRDSLSQFPSYASRAIREGLPAPHDVATFEGSKLDWNEIDALRSQQALALHRDLLKLRREDLTLEDCIMATERRFETAVLTDTAFLLRYFGHEGDDRLLVVNLGRDLIYAPAPEPLLAPPAGADWFSTWTSEDPRYGGDGIPDGTSDREGWRFPAFSAVLFKPSHA
jgi:maltooligosyltrehalose trehalohydrolase